MKRMAPRSVATLGIAIIITLDLGCGGGNTPPPPPPPPSDFTFSVGPTAITVISGTTSPPSVVSTAAKNGFSSPITVSFSGLPAGITPSPSSPFTINPGTAQEINFTVPAAASPGSFTLQFSAVGGGLSKSNSLTLKVTSPPVIRTYEDSDMLFMESDTGSEVIRVGLLKSWGGSITEVSINGTNYVNTNDPGRELQAELWDGNTPSLSDPGFWGTVQAGDHDYNGSPLLAETLTADSLYIKTQPLHWLPEDFGGGSSPSPSDIYFEQWITPVAESVRAFKIHYKITHFGSDTHANAGQEFPAVYLNRGVDRFMYYGGTSPWSYDALSSFTMPDLPNLSPLLYTPESWGAYVDANGTGIAVYTPGSYPYSVGFDNPGPSPNGTNDFSPSTCFTFSPGAILESNIYVIAGPVEEARSVIYSLRHQETGPSPFTPWTNVDQPGAGDSIRGTAYSISGWAFGTSDIEDVEVLADGAVAGHATYGSQLQGFENFFPHHSENTGFSYVMDTTKFSNGAHTIVLRVTDANGNVAVHPTIPVTIAN